MKILIVKPSSLGDIIHVFPALELLRRRYPEAQTDWLVHPAFADILAYSPLPVRRKILFDRAGLSRITSFAGTLVKLLRELRKERYDLVIDFQGLMRSSFFAFLTRRNGPVAGFSDPREKLSCLFYGRKIAVPVGIHAVERNAALVNALLETDSPVPQYLLPPMPEADHFADVSAGTPVIGIIPGARWQSKQFSGTLFAGVIRHLRENGQVRPVFWIIGSPNEQDAEKEIIRLAGNEEADIVPMTGKTTLCGMTEALRHCAAVLCNDSGPMHAAASLQIPVAAFFGPTRPDLTGPYGEKCRVLTAENVPCLGCMQRECPRKMDRLLCHNIAAEKAAGLLREWLDAAMDIAGTP